MSKSSTQKTNNEPPKWAKPLFEQSATEAQKLYNSGQGFNVYGGDRVANMNGMQMGALRGLNGLSGMTNGPTYSERNLKGIAAGKSLYGDSRFRDMLADQSAQIATSANLGFSGAGRYGSAAHAGTVADSVGDFRRDTILSNYQNERQNQLAANGMLDAGRQQRFQNRLTANQARLTGGTMMQQQRQAELDALMKRFQEKDMQGWTRLGGLQAAAAGAAGPYGMTTTKTTQPFNPLGILGSLFSFL